MSRSHRNRAAVLLVVILLGYGASVAVTGSLKPVDYLGWGDSMEPNLEEGDLFISVATERFAGDGATDDGIVTARVGERTGYRSFGGYGDVILFEAKNDEFWVHRAVEYVEEGDEWRGVGGVYVAESDGYITRGDNNSVYDQEPDIGLDPVPPEKIHGKAIEPPGEPNVQPVLESRPCQAIGCG